MNGNGHRQGVWWWACAIEKVSGRPVVLGPYTSEEEATRFGFEKIRDGDFKVYPFDTYNRLAARDKFKYKRLEQQGQLADVFKRARYKV